MYTPHTVTLYNVITETDMATFEEVERAYITILRGVFLDATKAVNVRTSGLEGADAVMLYIPFDVIAEASDGTEKAFAEPQAFWQMTDEERQGFWTLSIEGNGGGTFFVKGEVVLPVAEATAHDGAYNVTKVDTKDFGSEAMQHWEVGGA